MTIYNQIRTGVLITILLFWLSHWLYTPVPNMGFTPPWLILMLVVMLIKTVLLLPFIWLIKPGAVKMIQYLDFVLVFYSIPAVLNLMTGYHLIGGLQVLVVGGTLWICVQYGRRKKKAFKAQQQAEQLAAESVSNEHPSG